MYLSMMYHNHNFQGVLQLSRCATIYQWKVVQLPIGMYTANYTTTSTGMLLSKQKHPRCKIRGGQELKPFMSIAAVNNLVSSVDDNKVLTSSIQSMDLYWLILDILIVLLIYRYVSL